MRRRRAIAIPEFLEQPAAAYSQTGLAARAVFLRDAERQSGRPA